MALFNQYNRRFLKGSYNERTDKIIEGRRVLNMCKNKLKDFTFMSNKDFDSPDLRKFLLVFRTMCLTNWKMDILNSERGVLEEYDAEDEFENGFEDEFEDEFENESEDMDTSEEEDITIPSIFINANDTEENNLYDYDGVLDADFESYDDYDDLSSMSDDEFLEEDAAIYDNGDDINRDYNSVSTNSCRVLNNGLGALGFLQEFYSGDDSDEYDEKEIIRRVGSLQEKDFKRNNGKIPTVITSFQNYSCKRRLNPDEELSRAYKRVKLI